MTPNYVRDNDAVPTIQPVASTVRRPFWSVMIPTYNSAKSLSETLQGVLQQDPGPEQMQIEVVDDCSTKDDPEGLVRKLGHGRVAFYRQPHNVGVTRNFNTCLERSIGHTVHILHGDDVVLLGFYRSLQGAFEEAPSIGAAICRSIYIEEDGYWLSLAAPIQRHRGMIADWLPRIAVHNYVDCPAVTVKRDIYEALGGYDIRLVHTADWEMWKRIAAHYAVWYEAQPLACYRIHSGSDTSKLMRTGTNVTDYRKAVAISEAYLPTRSASVWSGKALQEGARFALKTGQRMFNQGDRSAGFAQLREAYRCDGSWRISVAAIGILARYGLRALCWRLHKLLPQAQKP